nr:uncharacterized protein LOC123842246 [Mirounga angustirostris]
MHIHAPNSRPRPTSARALGFFPSPGDRVLVFPRPLDHTRLWCWLLPDPVPPVPPVLSCSVRAPSLGLHSALTFYLDRVQPVLKTRSIPELLSRPRPLRGPCPRLCPRPRPRNPQGPSPVPGGSRRAGPLTPRRKPWKKCTSGCARSGSWHTSSSSERLRPGGSTTSQRTTAPSGPAAPAPPVSPGTLEMGSSSVTWSGDTRSSISWAQMRPWLSMTASFREASSTVCTPSSSPRQNVTRCWHGAWRKQGVPRGCRLGSHQPSSRRLNAPPPESLPYQGLHLWGASCFHRSD